MEDTALELTGVIVYVIGKPGAGKTTLVQACMSRMAAVQPDLTVAHLDEYELLMDRTRTLRADQVRWLGDGVFEVTDRSIFDELLRTLQQRVREAAQAADCVFVEFSRGNYAQALRRLIPLDEQSYSVVYVWAPLELCRKRNSDRPAQLRCRSVPDSVLLAFYQGDDLPAIMRVLGERLVVVSNDSSSLQDVKIAAEKVVEVVMNTVGAP